MSAEDDLMKLFDVEPGALRKRRDLDARADWNANMRARFGALIHVLYGGADKDHLSTGETAAMSASVAQHIQMANELARLITAIYGEDYISDEEEAVLCETTGLPAGKFATTTLLALSWISQLAHFPRIKRALLRNPEVRAGVIEEVMAGFEDTMPEDNCVLITPQIRKILKRWPFLDPASDTSANEGG